MLAFNKIDCIDTKEHFLFSEPIPEELVQSDLGSVTEQIHEHEKNASQEFYVIQVHSVRVRAIRDQVLGHRGTR